LHWNGLDSYFLTLGIYNFLLPFAMFTWSQPSRLTMHSFPSPDESPDALVPDSMQTPIHLDSTLQELKLYQVWVDVDCLGEELTRIFGEDPLLPGVILMESGKFLGVISRRRFLEQMSRPFGLELFSRRPIAVLQEFVQVPPLILPGDMPVIAAAKASLQRSPELLYEPIVVKSLKGEYYLLEVHQVLLAQSQIHELAMAALRASQQELAAEKELAQITLQSIGDGVITTDAEGRIKSLNPVAEALTGWTTREAQGAPIDQVFTTLKEHTRESVPNPVSQVLQHGKIVGKSNHTLLIARDQSEFAIDHSAAPILDRHGNIIGSVLVFRDVTQERVMALQLSWQARHDALTGLVNRHEFETQLTQICNPEAKTQSPSIICYLDLDRFKLVNDTCGHLAGDELLRQIANLLQTKVRSTDVIARLGGDEFGILLLNCELEQGMAIANDIRQSILGFRFVWQDKVFTIGVSIGVVPVDAQTSDPASILSQADTACYWAKNHGRNRVEAYRVDCHEQTHYDGVSWITRITRALEEDRFLLYCQQIQPLSPVAQNVPDCAEHYEVLLRMVDENGNIVPPGTFIPTAERYHLMPAIDRWVVSTLFATQGKSLRQCRGDCQKKGMVHHACLYSINLSGASINDEHLIDFLREQFAIHLIPPEVICFEITETVAIANLPKAARLIQDLKELGCRFALDDFGSGMSSFTYLKNLPVDYLKIDGSFVREIPDNQVATAMVEAINHIGHIMGLKTIAEFVENKTTLTAIREIGIDYAQGYAIARPQVLKPR
jgi:diguanylate cyclase (GGDEF)-like protein/PAS domain S-box-containing protein